MNTCENLFRLISPTTEFVNLYERFREGEGFREYLVDVEVLHFEPLSRSLVEGLKFVRAAVRLPLVNNVGDEIVLSSGLPISAKDNFFEGFL